MESAIDDEYGTRIIEMIQKSSLSREAQILDLNECEIELIRKILKSSNLISSYLGLPITDMPCSIYASDRLELVKWRLLLDTVEKTLRGLKYIIRVKNSIRRFVQR